MLGFSHSLIRYIHNIKFELKYDFCWQLSEPAYMTIVINTHELPSANIINVRQMEDNLFVYRK